MTTGVLSLKGRMSVRMGDGATSTDPRQKHTVAAIDEGIIRCINTWSFRMWERGTETEMGWRLPFYNLGGISTLSGCLTVLFWSLYSFPANLAPFPILWCDLIRLVIPTLLAIIWRAVSAMQRLTLTGIMAFNVAETGAILHAPD